MLADGTNTANIDPARRAALSKLLRIYGILSLIIFPTLMVGILTQSHLLAERGGRFNWTIWNDVRAGDQPAHVPPMLFTIYIVWAVFLLQAARDPVAHGSFLSFTMWANLFHGLVMIAQAAMDPRHYWSKFLTDIPFVLGLSVGIFLLLPSLQLGRVSQPGGPQAG